MKCRNRRCQKEITDNAIYCQWCGYKQALEPRKRGKRPNGSGTVYKLSGKRTRPWAIAKNGIILGYAETKAAALEKLEKAAGKPVNEKHNLTFAELHEEWKNEHYRELTAKGREGYDTAYKHFAPIYDKRFRDLRTKDYQAIIDTLADSGKSSSLQNKLKQLIGQMCKWAMREEIITINYAQHIKIASDAKKEKAIFSDEEISALEANGSDTAKIVLMLIYTGVRIGELFGAELENYHTTYFVGGSKTEAGKNRIIPIPELAREYFEYFAASAHKRLLDGYSGNVSAENFRKRDFALLMSSLGIEGKTPHSTRHTYTSRAVRAGAKPELLQKILGHANYSTTVDVYTHVDAGELISEAERIWGNY